MAKQPKAAAVGSHTISKLRKLYQERWGRDWPEDDGYLSELWLEARAHYQVGNQKRADPKAFDHCLGAMRESHPFNAAAGAR